MLSSILTLVLHCAFWISIQLTKIALSYAFVLGNVYVLRVAYKLYNEVYNESRKLRPSSKQAILITGATSGLGLAMSKHFRNLGYTVLVGYYSDQEPGYGQLQKWNDDNKNLPRMHFVEVNVRSQESIKTSYERVKEILENNRLDLYALINNAGISNVQPAFLNSRSKISAIVETNLLGPMFMVRQYVPLLARTKGSRIVNASSSISMLPCQMCSIYGSTKAALNYYSNVLSVELKQFNIKVVTIMPANLIANTSIVLSGTQDDGAVYKELTREEEELYHDAIELQKRLVENSRKIVERPKIYTAGKSSDSRITPGKIAHTLMGNIDPRLSLESTEVMQSYENAIRLSNPPLEMYAGNFFFNLFSSTFLELSSQFLRFNACHFLGGRILTR